MYFTFKNTRVHYRVKGNIHGLAVLLVHGFTETRQMWKHVYRALPDYHYLIPDLLGHGKSGLTGDILTMEEQAQMLRDLMDFQGIDKAVLIGHSMGGYIATAFAEMFPGRLAGLVLLNSHPFSDSEAKARARNIAVEKASKNKIAFLSEAIPSFFAPYNRKRFSGSINKLIRQAARMPVKGVTGALTGMKLRKDRSALFFEPAGYPKAWIISRNDPLIDAGAFEKQAKQYPHLFFRSLPDGHMSYVENPEELADVLQSFLQSITKNQA